MPTTEDVLEALKPVVDPEVNISLVDLGLIYDVRIDEESKKMSIDMTLTSPGCPVGPQLLAAIELRARTVPDIDEVNVNLVWQPPWDPRKHASEDAKALLGIWD